MCVICYSPKGASQPDEDLIRRMFARNPHGAGYMTPCKNAVEIHKGFMDVDDLIRATRDFGPDDAVVYHFRISTQAGVNPYMTQPFPYSKDIRAMRHLDVRACLGIAHNGVIPLTSDPNDRLYSDTAHFVAEYLPILVRSEADLQNPAVQDLIEYTTRSRLAIMMPSGECALYGSWQEINGCWYSNTYFLTPGTVKSDSRVI